MQQFYPDASRADSSLRGDLAADHFMEDSFVEATRFKRLHAIADEELEIELTW
jgi:hypothetical protein